MTYGELVAALAAEIEKRPDMATEKALVVSSVDNYARSVFGLRFGTTRQRCFIFTSRHPKDPQL